MSERQKITDIFERNADFFKTTVEDGIERERKGDMRITVTDADGRPVRYARLKITQKSHEFKFGANLFLLDELETDEKNELYKRYFADAFNMATLPFYWDSLEPSRGTPRYDKASQKYYRRPPIDLCMEFCAQHGIEPREHALAYERFFPDWLKNASVSEIKDALEKRYREISERYADKIRTIEVTNEMCWESGVTAFYEDPNYVDWCFKTAQKYFPSNQLVINEWTEDAWLDVCRPTAKYYAYTEAAMLKGARIDGIGMQFHMFYPRESELERTKCLYDPENLYRHLDLYSRLSKHLQITEITVPAYSNDAEDEEIQAEILEKLYSLWFSHPSVEQIIYWNLVDGYAYVPNPTPEEIRKTQGDMSVGENYYYGGLIRFDLTPKPAYYRIKNLIKNKWHTELDASCAEDGTLIFRGFYGDYEIKIEAPSGTVTKTVTLSSKGNNDIKITV